jgi:YD repeat-containing protein
MEGRKMAMTKSILRSAILILILVAVLIFPPIVRAATPINCGRTLSASISAAGEKDSYTFSGTANNGITIRARKTSGTLIPYLELYGPSGSLITSAANQIDRTLTQTGTYRIDVRDQNNTNTGNYLLYWEKMNNPCNVVATLACGQVVKGTIGTGTNPPPWRVYKFTASANDAVTIRARKTSGSSFIPYMELYDPSGTYIAWAYNYPMDRVLTTAGTYKVLIRDYYNAYAGDFTLVWRKVSTPCSSTPIICGQVLSGSLGGADEIDFFTFTGSANDRVTIRARKTSGTITPYLELYNPSGTSVADPSAQIDTTLATTGTYKILVRDSTYLNTGDYVLYWEKMNNPCNVVVSLACEQVVSGTIGTGANPPPWRVYKFTASANDRVTIRARKTSGGTFIPLMELYGPTGSYIAGAYNYPMDRVLTTAGTYKVLIRDYYNAYAGDFTLVWRRVSTPCTSTPISCGQILSGSISGSDEIDFYTFTGSANDSVTIRLRKISGTFTPYIEVYNPSGNSRIVDVPNPLTVNITLSVTGTYKILIRDQNYINTGDYLLYWEKMNNPCNVAASLTCEQVVSGTIGTEANPLPWKVYTFTASANDAVTIRARKTSGGSFIPYMELYDPSGTYIAWAYNYPLDRVLTAPGTYKILIRDYYNAYGGDFTLVWRKVTTPCTATQATFGQVLSGSISNGDEIKTYAFSASANDIVSIRTVKTSGTFTPYLELYNPSGSRIQEAPNQIDTTLTAAGTYTLFVRDQNYINTGSYAVTWQRWNNPSAETIQCGQILAGAIGIESDPPHWRYYSFTASANDTISIRIAKTSGSLTPYLELYNSNGSLVGSGAGHLDQTLSLAGLHTIVVRDQNHINTGNYLLTWQKGKSPCNATAIVCGQVLLGSVNEVVEIDTYTFTASAGDNVVLTLTRVSGGMNPSLELYNNAGARIAYQYTTSGNQVTITQTLPAAGSYAVFVSDYGMDETGPYTLKFQKNSNSCPEVVVTLPNGGERIVARSIFTIRWSSTDLQGISSQEIRLSTDGGQTFPTVIASGLQGSVQTYDWDVPADLVTNQGRIRVTATDTSGFSTPDDSDADFTVLQAVGRQYVYDELNRLIQIIYEDGRRVIYTYDAAGNRITLTNE